MGAGGLSRGCRLSLGKNDRDASVVWSSVSRGHPAFRPWGASSLVRTAKRLPEVVSARLF